MANTTVEGSPQPSPGRRSYPDLFHDILRDDDMTGNLIRIIQSVSLAATPIAVVASAVVVIILTRAPGELKIVIAGTSTVTISLFSWIIGRQRGRKRGAKGSGKDSATS